MDAIHALDVDVFAPCALGAILNDATIPQLKATVIAGAANNQLAVPDTHGAALSARGVLYAPDYCITAGGLIDIYYEGPACHAPVGSEERRFGKACVRTRRTRWSPSH